MMKIKKFFKKLSTFNFQLSTPKGFTLIELLVVIAILGILTTSVMVIINPSEQAKKNRDLQRKRNFDQIKKGLEIYYTDNNRYPFPADNKIEGVNWGLAWMPYMAKLPKDPLSPNQEYYYQAPPDRTWYRLYAKLERCPEDSQTIPNSCSEDYNYSVTSSNQSKIGFLASFITPAPTPPPTSTPGPTPTTGPTPTSTPPTPTPPANFITKWGGPPSGTGNGEFNRPWFVAVDSNNNVYVTDRNNDRIQKFAQANPCPGGTTQIVTGVCFVTKWGIPGRGTQPPGGAFYEPTGIAVDSNNNVYVADTQNNRIQKFAQANPCPGGTTEIVTGVCFVEQWGKVNVSGNPIRGTNKKEFTYPTSIAVDSNNNVYVVDTSNHRIQKFNSSGTFVRMWGFGVKDGLSVFQICTSTDSSCQKGEEGIGDGQFSLPYGIATYSDNNVYVADTKNNRIQKFTATGGYLTQWGSYGTDANDAKFRYPSGIGVASNGNIYVADTFNHRIQKFNSSLTHLATWGGLSSGTRPGQFFYPSGIAFSNNYVYVVDTSNHRIQKFSP